VKSGLFGQNPFISRYRLRGDALENVARISSCCVKKNVPGRKLDLYS
jgi:hypothetical protein